jgi:hypothetical protein
MRIYLTVFALASGFVLACSSPKKSDSSQAPEKEPPLSGGSMTDAGLNALAQLAQVKIQSKEKSLDSQIVSFHCEVFLKNENVPNSRLCGGVAFNLFTPEGEKLSRLFPNETGVFSYNGTLNATYLLKVENQSQWLFEEKGPFYSGRSYKITLRQR